MFQPHADALEEESRRRQSSCSLDVFEATLFLSLPVLVLHLPPSAGPETWWKLVGFP